MVDNEYEAYKSIALMLLNTIDEDKLDKVLRRLIDELEPMEKEWLLLVLDFSRNISKQIYNLEDFTTKLFINSHRKYLEDNEFMMIGDYIEAYVFLD